MSHVCSYYVYCNANFLKGWQNTQFVSNSDNACFVCATELSDLWF